MISHEVANGRGVAALLPQAGLRSLSHETYARPVRTVSDERRVPAEIRVSLRMTQDEPFNEPARRRVADRFLYGGRLACLGLAREIDRVPYRRKIGRERKSLPARRRRVAGPRRLALRGHDMFCMLSFHHRRIAVVPYSGRLMRLPGLLRLMAGPCNVVSRKKCEHSQGQETRQRM
jgi:hypothetical protein